MLYDCLLMITILFFIVLIYLIYTKINFKNNVKNTKINFKNNVKNTKIYKTQKSTFDGHSYKVYNYDNSLIAANMLATIKKNIIILKKHLIKNYLDLKNVNTFCKKINLNNMYENIPTENTTSYTVNKGEKFVICLRSQENPHEFVDINTIMYVCIHELSHIMTSEIGHTQVFWDNFRFLLAKSIECNIYSPTDYKKNPVKYCGIIINQTILK